MFTTTEIAKKAGIRRQNVLLRASTRGMTPAYRSENGKIMLWSAAQAKQLVKATARSRLGRA